MAVIRDKRDETWRYRKVVKLADGRKIRISGTPALNTKLAAEAAERAHIARALDPAAEETPKKEVPTFDAFATEFMDTYAKANNRPSEITAKKKILKHHLRPVFGSLRLDAITARHMETLKASTLDRGRSRKTVNNVLAVLSKILRYAEEIGVIERAPKVKLLKLPPSKVDFFDFDELERLVAAAEAEPEWRVAVLVAGDAGLRMGEVLALGWSDVDFKAGVLKVMHSDWMGTIGPTKGGRAREIPMTERLAAALRQHRHLRGPLVFCGRGGEAWTRNMMKASMFRLCKRAGLREVGWHKLRHTFCSHLAMRGAVPKAIQELAGHTTLAVTLRYMHLSHGTLRDAIRLLDAGRGNHGEQMTTRPSHSLRTAGRLPA